MKITVKIEGAPEGFDGNAVAREMLNRGGYEIASLNSITIKTDRSGATIGTIEGEARKPGDGQHIDF